MSLVSILTPVYNAAATLRACVQSVLAQDYHQWELVLVNDGSTDESGKICDDFCLADARIRVIHQANAGVSAARNAALNAAKGEYILFLDSDDALQPGALRTVMNTQRSCPDCWLIWRYTLGSPERDAAFWGEEAEMQGVSLLNTVSLAWLYNHCFFSMPWNKLYRADVIRESSLCFDTAFSLGEDLLFCLDYLKALGQGGLLPGICLVHKDLTYYRCGESEDTLSTKYRPDYCDLWLRIFARLNAECRFWQCAEYDWQAMLRAEVLILAEGIADTLCRGTEPNRRAAAKKALRSAQLKELCKALKAEKIYSPYYLPIRLGSLSLIARMAKSRHADAKLYNKLDWLGWYLLGGSWARE